MIQTRDPLRNRKTRDNTGIVWMLFADCRNIDPDLFFPGQGDDTAPAKAVCAGCPVRQECGDYALANRETMGIWGGMTERERRRLRHTARARKLIEEGL